MSDEAVSGAAMADAGPSSALLTEALSTETPSTDGKPSLVGLVLVSHSARLAEGAAELVRQLGGDEVPVEPAGGLPDGGLGTSSELIEQAVRAADRGAGVVVLADLGSAVLTVKLLLEDDGEGGATDPAALSATAILADAPLVEGAVSAAVAAASGADAQTVRAAAEEARDFRKL
jgi:PTS hybrid protein